ncbi:transposase [Roseofilum reptotaenium CS-1145]|uniref:Transposase n=1 Tax=Roseofilum reptotaenium AO1-A TaxID=1925591 RepID=A0A1L9QT56_9CYAN|nr:transposase [Roseofilum reptotaenium]MDB9519094.1 transposase [Roseofilum reptotaenium CS-1145]OJJ25848.1 transposase [Roseofilum reptotaenium AO1-A]
MPYRQIRFQEGCYYHVYNRGNDRQPIFYNRDNYLYFLRQFRRYFIQPRALDLVAYCLMPNHYHFLVYLHQANFSKRMQRFALSYTKTMNNRYKRVGSLFQGRFQAILVDSDRYLANLTRYIHLNPVRANLVESAADWEFSSYPEYLQLRRGTLPQCEIVGSLFESPSAYREFVEEGERENAIDHLLFD